MSPRTPIIALNLGSQSIELAEFQTEPAGGLILRRYLLREILADAANKEIRPAQITAAVGEMMAELKIASGSVNYTIAEEAVFSRFVELPAIGEEKIDRIIAFEAQQNVPFPLDEVVWDYQIVGGGGDQQIEVVLVAIKNDLLDQINRAVEETGLRTSIVDVATMALYNAFRFNYGDLAGRSLLIDIGARTTNLLFIEPGKVFTRSISLGGSSITSALAKEFNESFAAAEARKRKTDNHYLAENENGGIEDPVRVEKVTHTILSRLHAEVTRSISHCCTQQKGNRPERIFLSGGGAGTPDIQEFFREKLQLPVEFFDPLRKVAVADSAARETSARRHLLGEPVGLALRSTLACPMELNLRPEYVVRRHEMERRHPLLIAAAACFILGLLGWGAYYRSAAQLAARAAARLEEKVQALRRVETQMDQVRKETTVLDAVSGPLVAAINDRSFWPQILADLNSRLPEQDIWITELVPTSGGKPLGGLGTSMAPAVSTLGPTAAPGRSGVGSGKPAIDGLLVRGLYLFNPRQQEVVVDYFRNLIGSPWFAIDPNNQGKVIKPTTPNNTEWAFPYELRLDLKRPVLLP